MTYSAIAVPLRISSRRHDLCFLRTVTTFGTAIEITASELCIESRVMLVGEQLADVEGQDGARSSGRPGDRLFMATVRPSSILRASAAQNWAPRGLPSVS